MKKQLAALVSIVCLFLPSCIAQKCPSASSHAASSAADVETTGTTISDGFESALRFSTLADYKETLLTLTDSEKIYQTLKEASDYGEVSYDKNDFEMLLVDRYFLLPVLPEEASLLQAEFMGYGGSEFTIQLSDGCTVYLLYWHNKQERDKIENAEMRTWTNARGISIRDEQTSFHGYYTWKEGEYSCRMQYRVEDEAAYKSFLYGLSFDKVPLKPL